MPDISGYARISPSDQDVAGQTMRLTVAGAIESSRAFRQIVATGVLIHGSGRLLFSSVVKQRIDDESTGRRD
jgi:hypothetical protein